MKQLATIIYMIYIILWVLALIFPNSSSFWLKNY